MPAGNSRCGTRWQQTCIKKAYERANSYNTQDRIDRWNSFGPWRWDRFPDFRPPQKRSAESCGMGAAWGWSPDNSPNRGRYTREGSFGPQTNWFGGLKVARRERPKRRCSVVNATAPKCWFTPWGDATSRR